VALARGGHFPLREAIRTVLPFEEKSGAMRRATLPVPPVKSMLPFDDIVVRGGAV
jgi:hypothetical protein